MRKLFLLDCIIIAIVVFAGGCAPDGDYCCSSNDQCLSVNSKATSCTVEACGKCVVAAPLQIDLQTLPDATVGQKDYSVDLTASGGIPPYTWSLSKGDEEKLKWLIITQEGDSKATLHNGTNANNSPLYPTEPSDGISLTVTLIDSSKHGKDSREDNQGKAITMSIKINCFHGCQMPEGISPTTVNTGTKCVNGQLYNCVPFVTLSSGTCMNWDNGTACMCNNNKKNCCEGDNVCSQQSDKICKDNGSGKKAIYGCIEDSTTGCFVFGGTAITTCDNNLCAADGVSCGSCENNSKHCSHPQDTTRCTSNTSQEEQCTFDAQTGCYLWSAVNCATNQTCVGSACSCQGCMSGGQCQPGTDQYNCGNSGNGSCQVCSSDQRCINKSCSTSCAGCWDKTQQPPVCIAGNDVNKCGVKGADCFVCPENSADGKQCAVKSCTSGQCNYRYIITTKNVTEEVIDTSNNNTYWKRQIPLDNNGDPAVYNWNDASTKPCTGNYLLPSEAQLLQLVEIISDSSHPPMINSCAFPNTPASQFWSSDKRPCTPPSPTCDTNQSYEVNFDSGNAYPASRDSQYYVRCVRACCSL
jgi:hypothetical protein